MKTKHDGTAKRRGITRRWLLRCFTVIAAVVIAAAAALSVFAFRTLSRHDAVTICLCAAALGVVVIGAVVLVELRFIRSVVSPLKALTEMARRISGGSYGIQADKPSNDEIGDLFDSINSMSTEIAQGEKVQTEFISSVSHELRTPLTAITGWSETLAYDEDIKGDSRRGISIISKEASRLTKMVEELLEFTRIQGGRFKLNMEKIDITDELEDAVFTYSHLLQQEGAELIYTPCDEPLPLINGDSERLKQVFLNILDNAAKYGKSGGKIEVSVMTDSENVTVCVRDHGNGIPKNELPHVKEKFYKGSSKERGSGIGLAVCEEIISRHRGTLTIENAESGGVLVTVTLPV